MQRIYDCYAVERGRAPSPQVLAPTRALGGASAQLKLLDYTLATLQQ
ncbi:hypothetical protein TMM008_25060 [Pseudomonas sp. 008]|nr:hypothetical protein TMM008_25060 [Pseudomonas sp. 008]